MAKSFCSGCKFFHQDYYGLKNVCTNPNGNRKANVGVFVVACNKFESK